MVQGCYLSSLGFKLMQGEPRWVVKVNPKPLRFCFKAFCPSSVISVVRRAACRIFVLFVGLLGSGPR